MRVLFLCTHNSARSQMAEGLLRAMGGDRCEVFSAGTEAAGVRPLAIEAMREIGIDISGHESKTIDRFLDRRFDFVITTCDSFEKCATLPGAHTWLHWPFPDPAGGDLQAFRDVRDAIRAKIAEWIGDAESSSALPT